MWRMIKALITCTCTHNVKQSVTPSIRNRPVSVYKIPEAQCQSRTIKLTSQQTLLTSAALQSCGSASDVTLVASAGQTMNISLWSFKPSSASLGTLTDKLSGNSVEFSGASRLEYATSSVGQEMTLTLGYSRDTNFILDITGECPKTSLGVFPARVFPAGVFPADLSRLGYSRL